MKECCKEMVGCFETGRVEMNNIKSFKDYVEYFATDEPLLETAIKSSDPEDYYIKNIEPYIKLFAIYIGMKGIVAQLVELVIALDRQCYLLENGCKSKLYYVYKGKKSHHNIAIFAKR
eukprot:TRINITY_DN26368_c0_g1_i1.p1 TRINITY_DN26368_c0_g1~~TRINITY_DN26368_c0_g1_i1.p1  ORF type:complete len:118 (+),score=30.49 TRINITY_DN26368_c0_g1_i1:142-495(+)